MLIFVIARVSSSLRTQTHLGFLHHYASHIPFSFSYVSKASKSNVAQQSSDKNHSFTLSYLINSCGLSPKDATKVSKRVKLKDSDNPNSIINLFRKYDFSLPQISKIVSCYPPVLLANPEQNLLPRLRFFKSIGFSGSEFPEVLSYNTLLLFCSLERRIIPHYEALKGVVGDDVRVRRCLKSSRWHALSYDVRNLVPNIKVLRDTGVSENNIYFLLSSSADAAFIDQSKFVEYVNFVKGMGIKPSKVVFIEALTVVTLSRKSTWELKLGVFGRFGWSRDVTLMAFSKVPKIMLMSEKNITQKMKFFIDEVGWRPEDVSRYPKVLGYSLKNRTVPRWSVVKILKAKGLIKDDISPLSMIVLSEEKFLVNFVMKFQESVPQVLKLYRGELGDLPEVQA